MADEVIGSAVFEIRADLVKLRRDFDRARKEARKTSSGMGASFKSMRASVTKVTRVVGGLTAALALVSGSRGLVLMARNAIKAADNIGKTAAKLGVTTDELQEFRFAANQAGVATATLDMGLQRFLRRAAEAKKGTGEAKDAVAKLGISFEDAGGNALSGGELFAEALSKLDAVDDAGERLRLAFKLFDSEGVALVNLAANFEQARRRAREFGLVLDQDTIRQAEETESKLGALSMQIDTNLNAALLDLSPALESITRKFAELTTAASAWYASTKAPDVRTLRDWNLLLTANTKQQETLNERIEAMASAGNRSLGMERALKMARLEAERLRTTIAGIEKAQEAEGGAGGVEPISDQALKQYRKLQALLGKLRKDALVASGDLKQVAEQEFLAKLKNLEDLDAAGQEYIEGRKNAELRLAADLRQIDAERIAEVDRLAEAEAALVENRQQFVDELEAKALKSQGNLRKVAEANFLAELARMEELGVKGEALDRARQNAATVLGSTLADIAAKELAEQERKAEQTRSLFESIHQDFLRAKGNERALAEAEYLRIIERLDAEQGKVEEVAQAKLEAQETLAAKLNEIAEKERSDLDRIKAKAEDLGTEFQQAADNMQQSFSTAFADMLLDGENAFDALGKSFVRQFVNVATNALFSQLFGALGSAGGGGGNWLSNIFNAASGGTNLTGSGFVGEQGVEAVSFQRPAAVMTNERVYRAMALGNDGQSVTPLGDGQSVSTRPTVDGQSSGTQFTRPTVGERPMVGVFGAASGGTNLTGRGFVGEQGIEAVTFSRPAAVMTNERVYRSLALGNDKQSAGGGVSVVVNNYTDDQVSVQQRPSRDGGIELELLVSRVIARDLRGRGPAAQALEQTYQQRRVGRG